METTYYTTVETAKMLRKALKAAFPGVKFAVRSHSYSMGSSINVSYTDPSLPVGDVDEVANAFAGSDFNGMTDSTVYRPAALVNGERVRYGVNFVFTTNYATSNKVVDLTVTPAPS